jgi:hypothetical protein
MVLALVGTAVAIAAGIWFMTADDGAAGSGWRPAERAAALRNCVEACRSSPGVTPERYPVCDSACDCAVAEGEKTMTARDADAAAVAMKSNSATAQQKAAMEQMRDAGMRCAASAMPAKPAQK